VAVEHEAIEPESNTLRDEPVKESTVSWLFLVNRRNVALDAAYCQMRNLAPRVLDKLNHHPWTARESGFR
jgi:hypothetical protein